MERKKIVYVLHNIEVGGVEVALLSAIPALTKRYNLKVVVLGSITEAMIQHLSKDEQSVFTSFDYPLYLYPFALRKIVRFIIDFNPEILICSLWRASLVGFIVKTRQSRIKLFSFNHNTRFPHFFSLLTTKIAIRKADVVLADSVATSEFIQQKLSPRSQVKVVSFITQPTPEYITSSVPVPGDEIRFMFVGRISRVKNLDLAIRVIQHLRERSISACLDIYGREDESYVSDLNRLLIQKNLQQAVHFKGEITAKERNELFQHYHFYIQLSAFEGMAMSVVEAMQHGLVCIVSPVGEIVHYAKDMDSAVFINIDDPNSTDLDIEKIDRVIQSADLYRQISSKCHSNFLNKTRYTESLIEQIESGFNLY